jgi:hypothetical protein
MQTTDVRVGISLFYKARPLAKALGFKQPLERGADWQVLGSFPWGTVGYDSEEGIRVHTTGSKLADATKWVKEKAKELGLPLGKTGDFGPIHANQYEFGSGIPELDFISLGWEKAEYGFALRTL